ncbi:MAG TPA: 50S ribosomal protein L18 [Actinomycetota bacterium]|nr:50S ribosomal protein L18 [Actinomycetota bacterium]
MSVASKKFEGLSRRHRRVRKSIVGTPDRPRLAVYRSNRHIYAQVIDDFAGKTLAAASTLSAGAAGNGEPKEDAKRVGLAVAEKAKAAGVTRVRFDRGGFMYHGRVQALADGAREGGLEF